MGRRGAVRNLDTAYVEAAEFDRKMFGAWLARNAVMFTKRTEFPKLGYLIHLLNEAGIPSALHGDSFHAPLLWVAKDRINEAEKILTPRLDNAPDDARRFAEYANVQPDPDLWGE